MKQIILTGVSGSGKTTLMEQLLKIFPNDTCMPIQFTTRKPRDDSELDSYVFLTKEQFYRKMENWDFMETTQYNWEMYGVSAFFNKEKSNVYIVEPAWRAQLQRHFLINNVPFATFFIGIDKETARERMINRGDTVSSIEKRLIDFSYFTPEGVVLDGELTTRHNMERIALLCKLSS